MKMACEKERDKQYNLMLKIRFSEAFFKNKNELVLISLQNDILAHLPLVPIADNRLVRAHGRGPQGFEREYH